ncbi:MAG: TIGR03621 family F420-dependent LLM class oxidoreductase [Acidimicrobiales bacterium]|nr:TIGR03621 family F420-dependent LLM class oxidoreductase [Acidimicrobiales bacterium]
MAHDRRFRFGVQLHDASTAEEWSALARRAEELGYSSVLMPDHFGEQLAPVPGLMAAADATTDLRVGTLVIGNDYKHPVVLAKEMASLDVLSGGRVEFGIGAGWMNTDYAQAGIDHDRAGVRIERLRESIQVCRGLFGPDPVTFEGDHYRITGLDGHPKPVQRPHPPFLIGGGGRRVLSLAAHEADIVGINPKLTTGEVDETAARNGAPELTDEKIRWVREAAGDRYADLELNMLVFAVVITDDRPGVAEMMAPMFGLDPDLVADYPLAWIGTEDEIVESLQARRERWDVSYLVVQHDAMEAAAPIVARLTGT